jgi:hypothetical protein
MPRISPAADLPLPKFEYIVAHGVYSWVGPLIRADMRAFIARHIKHGGLVYISYNAMPGRAADLPFQRLVRAVGETCAGDSTERVAAALIIVDSLLALKAPALVASPMLTLLKEQKSRFAPAYLTHEYMGQHWDPMPARRYCRTLRCGRRGRCCQCDSFVCVHSDPAGGIETSIGRRNERGDFAPAGRPGRDCLRGSPVWHSASCQ